MDRRDGKDDMWIDKHIEHHSIMTTTIALMKTIIVIISMYQPIYQYMNLPIYQYMLYYDMRKGK